MTAEEVYAYIKGQVAAKELFPGARIVEDTMAQELSTSRTQVRAALRRLAFEGLVTIVPHRGSFVARPTECEIRAAYECRMLIESETVRLAAGRISPGQLDRLRELVRRDEQAHADRDMQRFLAVNDEFHLLIAGASGNSFYERFLRELSDRCNVYLLFYDRFLLTPPEQSQALREHRAILRALSQGDADGAVAAMRRHTSQTLEQLYF
ncbi:MAG TPA: GntR family transcriptional regulator [Terriglobales bacterium]|nr:GntR family transcriptional regulator [Terriglobales bacterium]